MRRFLSLLIAFLCLSGSALAQTSNTGVVDVPLSVRPPQSGVVPTSILPMGALRIESGGVRLPGPPPPQYAPVASIPAPSQIAPSQPAPTTQGRKGATPASKPGATPTTAPSATSSSATGSGPAGLGATKPSGCVGALDAPLQVQLGAVEGRAAADKEADRLMRRHGDLLGARPTPTDCAVKLNNTFRLRLAVPSPAEGQRLCNELAGRGERCILVRGG